MKICALLSWWQEDPDFLHAAISSAAGFIDHVVAVDGAYALMQDGTPDSSADEYAAIMAACHAAKIGFTIHRPRRTWKDNETEKRSYLFRMGDAAISNSPDPNWWYFVLDADEIVTDWPRNLKGLLKDTDHDAAAVAFDEPGKDLPAIRVLFRAIPGIRVETNHYSYVTPDGRFLWGNESTKDVVPCLDLSGVFTIKHLTNYRDQDRHDRQYAYYRKRDKEGHERGICEDCNERRATHTTAHSWEKVMVSKEGIGAFPALAASWKETCDPCNEAALDKSRREIQLLGFDPDELDQMQVDAKGVIQ